MIKKYLKDPKQNYLTFDIKYTKKESDYLDNLNITKEKYFNHTGNIIDLDNNKLNNFLNDIGNNKNIDILNKIIHKILVKISNAYQTKYIMLDINVTLPTKDFDEPLEKLCFSKATLFKKSLDFLNNEPIWHKDGNYYQNSIKDSKFLTLLKGPGTLFIKKSKKVNEIYYKYSMKKINEVKKLRIDDLNRDINNKYNKIYVREFKDFKHNQVKTRDGLIFFVGNYKDGFINGLLHSEPKKDVPRFFISIIPGSYSEIEEYKTVIAEYLTAIESKK